MSIHLCGPRGFEFFFNKIVATFFQFEGELFPTTLHDSSRDHYVNDIGNDVVEQSLVVGDQEDPEVRSAEGVHSSANNPQCIDV